MIKPMNHRLMIDGRRAVLAAALTALLSPTICAQETPAAATAETTANTTDKTEAADTGDAAATTDKDATTQGAGTATTETAGESTEQKRATPEIVEELPFKIRPYEVLVTTGFAPDCLPDNRLRAEVIRDIDRGIQRMFGDVWDQTVEESPWLAPGTLRKLERVSWDGLSERYTEMDWHKVFLVTIENRGSGYLVACREADLRIHEVTASYSEEVVSYSLLAPAIVRLMRDAFRPCLLFQRRIDGEGNRATMVMQTQAGEILPPDPSAVQVTEGDVLRPFIRQMERRNPRALRQLKPITLTYLKVLKVDTEVSRGLVEAFYLTHLNPKISPFGGKGRSQEHFAVRQRPTADESRVRLVLRSRPDKPLISHRLALAYQLYYQDEEDGEQTKLVSDRNGEVVIQRRENHPTFWIRVYSGSSLLARVPYAPGLIPFDTIMLPDDSVRLEVEGELQLLADDLIDAIALRGVLLARARKFAAEGNTQEVESLFDRYDAVPSRDQFLERISNIRVSATSKAEKKRLGTRLIRKQCEGIESTINAFFSDQKRAARSEEINKIKQLAEQKAK